MNKHTAPKFLALVLAAIFLVLYATRLARRPSHKLVIVPRLDSVAVNPRQTDPRWDLLKVDVRNAGANPETIWKTEFYCGSTRLDVKEAVAGNPLFPGDVSNGLPLAPSPAHSKCDGPFFEVRVITVQREPFQAVIRRRQDGTWTL